MRCLIPLLLLAGLAGIAAEDARPLDPKKPDDAVQIVAQICAQVPLKMAESQAVLTALQTLAAAVQPHPAPTAPKPDPDPKAKP